MGIVPILTSRSGIGTMSGLSYNCRASGRYSVAMGSGTIASAVGTLVAGSINTVSGNYSVSTGYNNRVYGSYGTMSGSSNIASGDGSCVFGYSNNTSGSYILVAGSSNTVSGNYSVSTGSYNNAAGDYSTASGSFGATSRYAQWSHSAGRFVSVGDAQASRFVTRVSTTDATATELKLDGSSAYLTVGATRTMSFVIRCAAHRTDVSGTAAAWPSITGGITRDSTGNCRLLGSIAGAGTTTMCDAGAATWTVAVTADATNNRLAITVTGEAGKTIRWVASIDMAEVG